MSKIFLNLVGLKFGRLKAINCYRKDKRTYWLCLCDCGKIKDIEVGNLIRNTRSCGCLRDEKTKKRSQTHGMSGSRFLLIWRNLKRRCNDKNDKNYHNYGGRGIKTEWKSFESFMDDMYESYLEHCKEFSEKQTTIDRVDVNGNYCKENCRWATWEEQANNRRKSRCFNYKGETLSITGWERKKGFNPGTLFARLKRGWEFKKALTTRLLQ